MLYSALILAHSFLVRREEGASLVEYAVALIVVTLVGGVIFSLGGNVSTVIDNSAGAF